MDLSTVHTGMTKHKRKKRVGRGIGSSHRSWDVPAMVVNVGDLDARCDAGNEVSLASLKAQGVLKGTAEHLRVLGEGDVTKKLTVHAHHFSASAKEKIEKA